MFSSTSLHPLLSFASAFMSVDAAKDVSDRGAPVACSCVGNVSSTMFPVFPAPHVPPDLVVLRRRLPARQTQ